MRVHPCLRPEQLDAASAGGLRSGEPLGPDPLGRLHLGWLKTFADGSLGSRTAALLEPLGRIPGEPEPANGGHGVWMVPPDMLRAQAERAASLGIATQVHGIGDAAVRAALDALAPTVGRTPLMPRVEHVQLGRGLGRSTLRGAGDRGVDAARPRPVGRRQGPPALGAAGRGARLRPGGPGSDRGGHPRGNRRAGGAGRSLARSRLRRDAVRPVVACRAPRRSGPATPSTSGGPSGPRAWIRRSAPAEADRGRLVPGHRADLVVIASAAVTEPVEVGGALWHARPSMVLMDGRVVAES